MSTLTSFRRNLRREAGTLFPRWMERRSWAIYRNHGKAGPWLLIDGFKKEGTKPGHRRARRLLRTRHGWANRNRSTGPR
jgi:hypothetical protein